MNIDETIVRHSTLTNGTAGLVISLITCSETAVPIRMGQFRCISQTVCSARIGAGLQSGARLVVCQLSM